MKPLVIVAMMAALGGGTDIATTHDSLSNTLGVKVASLGIDSNRWTGWINTTGLDDVTFQMTFTDANDSVTDIRMVCETENDATDVANDAGFDVCSRSTSSGTSTYTCPHVWLVVSPSGVSEWQWTIENVNANWLNCEFYATGTPAAADTLYVFATGVSP